MKKSIALILALVMCLFCFGACSGNDADDVLADNAGDSAGTGSDTVGGDEIDASDIVGGESDLAYVQDKGDIIVGITYLEPLDFQDAEGNWVGFDAEVAMAVAEKLGVSVKFQEISWEAKETELAAKQIDCIWNGLTITPTRQEEMSISTPYMLNKQVAVVRAADADKYATVEDFASAAVAAEAGSAGEEIVNTKMADATYIEKGVQLDALTEVKALTADAAVIDFVMAYYLINKDGSDYADLKILDIELSEPEYYGIAFRKGSDLTAKVNELLSELTADGTIGAIAEKYGLTDAVVLGDE